jgi:hypothetical protein
VPPAFARWFPLAAALPVALIALRMAVKGLGAREWLPFHGAAAGVPWSAVEPRLRSLLLFFVRLGALGFLVVLLALVGLGALAAWRGEPLVGAAGLALGCVWCLGLGVVNHALHHATGAGTPWRGALLAGAWLGIATLVSGALGLVGR